MFDIKMVINRMLIRFPIFKLIINNLEFLEDSGIKTACTTGKKVYYNVKFLEGLSKDEQVFILAHELMHITLKHLMRVEERDMEVWNYATDAVINQILVKNGLPMVEGVINCEDAANYSSEEYYQLIKNREDCEELMKKYRDNSELSKNVASHNHWNKEKEELDDKIPNIDEKAFDKINKDLIKKECDRFVGSIGESKGGNSKIVFGSVGSASPVLDWKQILKKKKDKIISAGYNLMKGEFNEEGIYYYPYEVIKTCEVEILIDTSISVDDELVRSFLRECKNIFGEFKLKVGCFDTEFYGFHEIKNVTDLDNFVIEGRGATDFEVAVNAFSPKSKIKIVFTDGEASNPKKSVDAMWIVYSDEKINPPGGQVIYVDKNNIVRNKRVR